MSASERSSGGTWDAIVIGGGHNGLVAACYLGRAGRGVLLLEAASRLGGALVTSDITPGYRVSTAAHFIEAMPRQIEKDLRLARHGLRFARRPVETVLLSRDRNHLLLSARRRELAALKQWNEADARAYGELQARFAGYAKALAPLFGEPMTGSLQSRLRRLVWRAESLGSSMFEEMLHDLAGSIGDLVESRFTTDAFRAAVAFEAVLGTAEGPFAPGTALRLAIREAMRVGAAGRSVPLGGAGGFIEALARAADAHGVVLRTSSPVAAIRVEDGVANAVVTAAGEICEAPLILSSADPRHTMLDLLGAEHLDAGATRRVSGIAARGATAKLNLALDGLPAIPGLAPAHHGARLLVVPSLEELDQAYLGFKRGEVPLEPVMEVTIPSIDDATLAPEGQHVMSILVQYVPYEVKGGWGGQRDGFVARVIDRLSVHAPDLRQRIVAGELLLPSDIEAKFGLAGGEWSQGAMRPDQLLLFRPTPEFSGMPTTVKGLYLCGAGSHPGGGVTGLPGRFAAELALSGGRGG